MAEYHCGQIMRHEPIPLKSGRIQNDYRCAVCGHEERIIQTPTGILTHWINMAVRKKLAESESGGV